MTPEEHNKYLGLAHLAHGGLFLLMVLFMLIFMTVMMSSTPGAPPAGLMAFMWIFLGGLYGLMTAPSIVAGYGLLKRRKWARTAAIIGGVTAAMSFPIGTAVCAYTFWFLFSEPGKFLYDKPQYALPNERMNWQVGAGEQRDVQYTPPQTPPDWR